MGRSEKLVAIATVLKQAADKARGLSGSGHNGASRVGALAVQIDGIALEFEIIARDEADPAGADLKGVP